jgi:PKD repeat protein
MLTLRSTRSLRWLTGVAALAAAATACTLEKQSAPSFIGPSEFSTSVTFVATPDTLPRDASSQSVVVLTARDPQNRPISGQRFTLRLTGDGSVTGVPVGATLSASEVVTDGEGRATFGVTAPQPGSVGNSVIVVATPVGTNADNASTRSIGIALTPFNRTAPSPDFDFSPEAPEIGQLVTFDASETRDEGVLCNELCTYEWDFGDGSTATGRIVSHQFQSSGDFSVRLTVTDPAGTTTAIRATVGVGFVNPPIVTFTFSPAAPAEGQTMTFTATATPSANHRIVTYTWSWGDGKPNTQTGSPVVQHTFDSPGTYTVSVTVTDDLGQTAKATQTLTVN